MKTFLTCAYLFFSITITAQDYNIYVSDAGNFNNPPWQIVKYDSNGENPEAFISENLAWPQDILFLEDEGTVLISNLNSNKISIYDAETGAYISDFATNVAGPTRMKIGPNGLLYVLQWNGDGKVMRFDLELGTFLGAFTSVGVPQSIGLDWDDEGMLYVSSYNMDHVRMFDANGVDQGLFIDSDLLGPTNIWFDENGDLLVSDYNGTAVKRFNEFGEYQEDYLTGLSNSEGVAYTPAGHILIGNGATHAVKEFDSNGTFITDIVPNGLGNLLTPNAVVLRYFSLNTSSVLNFGGPLIIPSLGVNFRLDSLYAQSIQKIEVYNTSGYFVASFSSNAWNASHYANGPYILKIHTDGGEILSQKIVVHH